MDKENTSLENFETVWKKYFFKWSISFFILGFLLSIIDIKASNISLFKILGKTTPAITKWANASNNYDLALLLWIYSTYSVLFYSFKLVLFTSFKKKILKPWKLFIYSSLMVLFLIFPFFHGSFFGFDITSVTDNPQKSIYLETDFGIVLITWMIGSAFMFFIPVYIIFLTESLRIRQRLRSFNNK